MDSFLIILLIVLGYFILLSLVAARLRGRGNITTAAVIVLFVYGCGLGMLIAIGRYLGELGLLLYAVSAVYSFLFLGWKLYWSVKRRPKIHLGVLVVLAAYLLAVLYITIFMREEGAYSTVQMEVFNWTSENGVESFQHILLNVVMFVPVGMLYPLLTDGDQGKMISSVSFGMMFSVWIETGQLILRSGTCDIDDILSNSLGCLIGGILTVAGMQRRKKGIRH